MSGIEIEYPNTHTYEPEFTGAVIKVHNDELFIRSEKVLEVEKGSTIKVTEIFANHKRGITCDIVDFGNLNDINKDYKVEKDSRIIFRKDNIVMGSVTVKAVEQVSNIITAENTKNKEIEIPVKEQEKVKLSSEESKINLEPNIKYFHLTIDNKDVYIKNGEKIHIKLLGKACLLSLQNIFSKYLQGEILFHTLCHRQYLQSCQ